MTGCTGDTKVKIRKVSATLVRVLTAICTHKKMSQVLRLDIANRPVSCPILGLFDSLHHSLHAFKPLAFHVPLMYQVFHNPHAPSLTILRYLFLILRHW